MYDNNNKWTAMCVLHLCVNCLKLKDNITMNWISGRFDISAITRRYKHQMVNHIEKFKMKASRNRILVRCTLYIE